MSSFGLLYNPCTRVVSAKRPHVPMNTHNMLALTKYQASAVKKTIEKKKGKYDGLVEGRVYKLPRGSNKEFIVIVDGHPIRFGDPHMPNHEDDDERRKNFRARHQCDQKHDRTTAGYWACRAWEKGFEAHSLPEGVHL